MQREGRRVAARGRSDARGMRGVRGRGHAARRRRVSAGEVMLREVLQAREGICNRTEADIRAGTRSRCSPSLLIPKSVCSPGSWTRSPSLGMTPAYPGALASMMRKVARRREDRRGAEFSRGDQPARERCATSSIRQYVGQKVTEFVVAHPTDQSPHVVTKRGLAWPKCVVHACKVGTGAIRSGTVGSGG